MTSHDRTMDCHILVPAELWARNMLCLDRTSYTQRVVERRSNLELATSRLACEFRFRVGSFLFTFGSASVDCCLWPVASTCCNCAKHSVLFH